MEYPVSFATERELDEFLSTPWPETVDMMRRLEGDITILGIGGKMGPTIGRMAVRAARLAGTGTRVYGVSRFSDPAVRGELEADGIECVPGDLLDPDDVARLPRTPNVVYMAGRKFGIRGTDYLYWAMNAVAPANAARHYRGSGIVMFSTGSIYPFWPVGTEGPSETDATDAPGEYASSCLARERIFEYYSREQGTGVLQYRLNYAIDLRYGVLYEIGRQVWEGSPVDLDMGYANVIWQGDAANIALLCLEHASSPPAALNVTGPKFRIRDAVLRFGELMDRRPSFTGGEALTALLSNTERMRGLYGDPPTSLDSMLRWTADWIMRGGSTLNKPTHFQTRDGQFLD